MRMAGTSYKMPTNLKSTTSEYAAVSPNKLSVKSTGAFGFDCFSVQANRPVPVNMGSDYYYYFEMRVKKAGASNRAAIGYSEQGFPLSKYLGYNNTASVGYHGDDGKIYAGRNNATFCTEFTTNDIVGAGINYASKQIFFTKNGELVGTVSNNMNGPLFPTVSVFGSDEELKLNFGHKPFAYDDVRIRYPFPYWNQPDDSQSPISKGDGGGDGSSSTKDECWKMLMKMCESSLRKIEEELAFYRKKKEEEVATLRTVMKDLEKHL